MSYFLDFIPLVIFFAVYHLYGINMAIIALSIALSLLTMYQWKKQHAFPTILFSSTVLVIATGGITIWLDDPLFIQLKPTFLYLIFAVVLYILNKYKNINLFQRLFSNADADNKLALTDKHYQMILMQWILFFVLLAWLNLYVQQTFVFETWLNFKVFGILLLNLLFILFQGIWIYNIANNEDSRKG